MEKAFQANFDSLRQYRCPEWFQDAKFGIWSHWGPQSVPMQGDWYARSMYIQDSPAYIYHLRHYGHPSEFGYKDICALWKAEKFNPDELMSLYHKAGARYFVAQAMHHDNFFNYKTKLNRFNSVDIGPHMDICAMWKTAAEKYNLPFGLSEHLAPAFSWWYPNKGADTHGAMEGVPYDGNDPEYRDFYFDNYEHIVQGGEPGQKAKWWFTLNKNFQEYWLHAMNEMIESYQPDLLYTDGELPFGQRVRTIDGYRPFSPDDWRYRVGLEAVSNLYNTSIEKYGENRAVYCQKDHRPEVYRVGILDLERAHSSEISPYPWQNDTCLGRWFYDAQTPFKQPKHIIEILVDVVSKNGTMLLNVPQLPDGTIDQEEVYILEELASWFAICSEGIYGTRPWHIFGEGVNCVLPEAKTPVERENPINWTESDYRFTQKNQTVYAFMMQIPEQRKAVIKSFDAGEKVSSVKLLGYGDLHFSHEIGVLVAELPEKLPTKYPNCLAVTFE